MEQQQQNDRNTEQEESIFSENDWSTLKYHKHIRNARIMLFVLAGIQLLPVVAVFYMDVEEEYKWIAGSIYLLVALSFAALGFWARKNPYSALVTAIIVYGALIAASAIIDPSSIAKGMIVKVIAIVLLVQGIRNAKEAKELKETFGR